MKKDKVFMNDCHDSLTQKNILISIIVPVFNTAPYLVKCIESICDQTYKHLEIILIDDGSTDESPEICDKYAQKDERIIVLHKHNEGQSVARNIGLDIAKGDYFGFVDSDDYIDRNMYQFLLETILTYGADIAQIASYYPKPSEEQVAQFSHINNSVVLTSYEELMEGLWINKTIKFGLWSKLFDRYLWDGIRMEEGVLHQDMMVMCKLLKRCKKFIITQEKLYAYVQTPTSASRKSHSPKAIYSHIYAANYLINFMNKNSPKIMAYVLPQSFKLIILAYIKLRYSVDLSQEAEEKYKNDIVQIFRSNYLFYKRSKVYSRTGLKDRMTYGLFYINPILLARILPIVSLKARKLL